MIIFWLLAALLIALALLFVIPPLLSRRAPREGLDQDALNLDLFQRQIEELDADLALGKLDQHQYNAARRDLERELLYDLEGARPSSGPGGERSEGRPLPAPTAGSAAAATTGPAVAGEGTGNGRWAAVLLAIVVPASVVSLYLLLGNSAVIQQLAGAQPAGVPSGLPPLDVMVERLEERLQRQPNDPEGWVMLGRTYFAIGQPAKAVDALGRAYGVAPGNPDVLVTYAEALAANNDSNLAGRPAELIAAALEIDPQHTSARWLQGLASFQGARYDQAAEQWELLAASFERNSEEAEELERYIAEARRRADPALAEDPRPQRAGGLARTLVAQAAEGTAPTEGAGPAEANGKPAAASGGVTVAVTLAEDLWTKAQMDDSLFVYAKAISGPPMPLAVHRGRVADLPLTLTLDDSLSMMPSMRLSAFDRVMVGARISKGGQATPRSGDLEGEAGPVEPGAAGTVKILIDRVRP